MIALTIKFKDEVAMLEWVEGAKQYGFAPERAKVRERDALDPSPQYIMSGEDGYSEKKSLKLVHDEHTHVVSGTKVIATVKSSSPAFPRSPGDLF